MNEKKENALISVIMPTYNRGYCIQRSVNSVLNQTYSNLELIIVDDCSTDNTESIIGAYNDLRISYIKLKKNIGACAARNLGIQRARGKYIAFQDSDDEWLETKLEEQYIFLKKMNADMVFCSFYFFEQKKLFPQKHYTNSEVKKELLKQNLISTQTIFSKREVFDKYKFDEKMPRFQDWDVVLRIVQTYNISHLHKGLVNVYRQNNSLSCDYRKAYKAVLRMIEKYKNNIYSEKENLARIYCMAGKMAFLSKNESRIWFYKAYKTDKKIKYLFMWILNNSLGNVILKKKWEQ